jgi:hypothetical protein
MAFCNLGKGSMLPNVIEFLSTQPLLGTDDASLDIWKTECELSWAELAKQYLTPKEAAKGAEILSTLLDSYQHLARLVAAKQYESTVSWTTEKRVAALVRLCDAHQIEQRTTQWYMDAMNLLTASQFSTILKAGRTRGQLVLDKASGNVDTSNRVTVCTTKSLNPFTWGIRFEPLVKEIYQALTQTTVREMGRLHHRTDKRLAASPDGLVVKGPSERLGRFVEFKAPVSRVIIDKVPDDYMTQMQIQMEVGDVEECDYLEVKFNSHYQGKSDLAQQPPGTRTRLVFYGTIFLIEKPHEDGSTYRYDYSPLNTIAYKPTLEPGEDIAEEIPWWSDTWFLTTVGRSRTWFDVVKPTMEEFWRDVTLAREGKFVLPASTRKPREAACKIVEDSAETAS